MLSRSFKGMKVSEYTTKEIQDKLTVDKSIEFLVGIGLLPENALKEYKDYRMVMQYYAAFDQTNENDLYKTNIKSKNKKAQSNILSLNRGGKVA